MSSFSGSPRLIKGALIGMDPLNPLASVVIFQYNPKNVQRSVSPSYNQGSNQTGGPLRFSGAPEESIDMELQIDATDQLEQGNAIETSMGIYPQLSALELLAYPKSAGVIANSVLMAAGSIEIIPPEAPLTLLVWGAKRVVPVKLRSLSITEEEFDPQLNPIRASASVALTVLTYNDFAITHPGFATFMAHQIVKETMAVVGSASASIDIQL